VLNQFAREKERVVSNLVREDIESKFRNFGKCGNGLEEIKASFIANCGRIDVQQIYRDREAEIERIVKEGDYQAALRYYARRGLHACASDVFSTRYGDQILRWLRDEKASELIEILRSILDPVSPWGV